MLEFNLSIISASLPFLAKGMLITLQITVCAIIAGMVIGTFLAIAGLSRYKPLQWFAKIYVPSSVPYHF